MTDDSTSEHDGPTLEEAKEAAARQREQWKPDPDAADLPEDVRDGEAGDTSEEDVQE